MVELRTLTPSVLVRIQLPQPKIEPALCRLNFWLGSGGSNIAMQSQLVRLRVSENKPWRSLSANECRAAAFAASESSVKAHNKTSRRPAGRKGPAAPAVGITIQLRPPKIDKATETVAFCLGFQAFRRVRKQVGETSIARSSRHGFPAGGTPRECQFLKTTNFYQISLDTAVSARHS